MLYIRSLLVIHFVYSGVYMSIPNSLTISSPSATMSLFSKSVSLFLLCNQADLYHLFLDSTNKGCHNDISPLTYFTQHDNLQVHPCCCKCHYFILFQWLSNIPLNIYTTSSLSIPLLFPCLGYCKQCFNEHWGTCFSDHVFLWVYAQE